MKEYEPKKIYCPECNRCLGAWDGRTKTELVVNCRKCNKRIIYHPTNGQTETKKIPPRVTASGSTFY